MDTSDLEGQEPEAKRKVPHASQPSVGTVVGVIWDDAEFWPHEVEDPEALREECLYYTVGFVTRLSEKALFLACEQEVAQQGFRGVSKIPWNMVRKIEVLRAPEV